MSNSRGKTVSKPAAYSTLSFVNINNPNEAKLRSKKRAVRSHVAYLQHHKDDGKEDVALPVRRDVRPAPRLKTASTAASTVPLEDTLSPGASPSHYSTSLSTSTSASSAVDISPPSLAPFSSNSPFHGTRVDPFQTYPVPWKPIYEPILDFYLTQILIDTEDPTQKGNIFRLRTSFFPFIMATPTTFYSAMAFAGTMYALRTSFSPSSASILSLRQEAISGINAALSSPSNRQSDAIIGAVFLMCLLESFGGDTQSYRIHVSGLHRMVALRGGLGALGLEGLLARMIVWLDFKHAKVHGTRLVFGESTVVESRLSPFLHLKEGHDVGLDGFSEGASSRLVLKASGFMMGRSFWG